MEDPLGSSGVDVTGAAVADGAPAHPGMDTCEVAFRRISDPAFGGHGTLELRAVASLTSGAYVAGRVRYRGPHAIDLAMPEHRSALDRLTEQLTAEGWRATGERGATPYALRFERSSSMAPPPAQRQAADEASLVDRVLGLTKHTKRLAIFLVVGVAAAALVDLVRGRLALVGEWPSLVSVAVALTWILAATDDFKMGTQHRIPKRIETEGPRHPVGWYRFFLTRVVHPVRVPFGWLIPGSMYIVAALYLAGIIVPLAAVGALFLLANMFLFLNLRAPRDDFVVLAVGNSIVLLTNPGGLPAIVRALGGAA
jgi:hypothetical protein